MRQSIFHLFIALLTAASMAIAADPPATSTAPAFVPPPAPVIKYPITVGTARQLFVDDVLIESMKGVQRTYHAVSKYEKNPIMIPDKPWETQALSILSLSILRDPKTENLRVWYSAWGKQVNLPTFMCVADSKDGIQWEKP